MAKIENIKKVEKALEALRKKSGGNTVSVIVGYTAKYALFVHESRGMVLKGKPRSKPHKGYYWDPQGVAKAGFLMDPARDLPLGKLIRDAFKAGATLVESLKIAGLRLQRESQKQVPVDLGNLKGSAFTKIE